jgi:hypothetical protein
MKEEERSTSSASLHAHTQLHHPTLRFFNRLTPLSVTLHFLREFIRKIEHGTCSATLYRAYSSNPKNCERSETPRQNRGENVSTYPVTGRPKGRAGVFVLEKPKMSMQANLAPGLTEAWRPKKLCELMPEDIDEEWMDLMVKRLFRELDRQLNAIEQDKVSDNPAKKAQVARTLASMERSLGRLTRIEMERAAKREQKVTGTNDDKRAILERRLDHLSGIERAAGVPDESK